MPAHYDSLDRTSRARKLMRFVQQNPPGFLPIVVNHGEIIDHAGLAARIVNRWRFDQIGDDETAKAAGVLTNQYDRVCCVD